MKTTLNVSDDGILTLTEEIHQETGWREVDMLEWIDNGDVSVTLTKFIDDDL